MLRKVFLNCWQSNGESIKIEMRSQEILYSLIYNYAQEGIFISTKWMLHYIFYLSLKE